MPHEQQAHFGQSPAKRKVLVTGRRAGKTTGAAMLAVEEMLHNNRRVLEAAPTHDQTTVFWELCRDWLYPLIDAGLVYKNETNRLLEFKSGGRIRTKTAFDADTLRGDYADLLILDEFADMSPSAWDEVGAPMLLDNDGDAVFIGTPRRKNHFHSMYARALGDDTGRWAAWHFTSHDNPYLSSPALAEITADMTEEAYRQEIMAEFLDNEGAVFRNIAANLWDGGDTPEDHAGHTIVMGVDWGQSEDFTVLSIACANCKRELELDRFHGMPYPAQRDRLKAKVDQWHVQYVLAESNAMGQPNIDDLQWSNLPVEGFATTASSKPPLIESMALSLEQEEVAWLANPIATSELEAYERTMSAHTNRPRYSAPEGVHDDTVMARALCRRAMDIGQPWAVMIGR